MLKLSCLITGDDYNLVKNETPNSRKKISLYGMIILLPVMLWVMQGFLIAINVFNVNLTIAIITSFFAGVIVFIIEKAIIMSNGGKGIFFTRFMLGILIAAVGALMVDEIIFKNDIQRQLEENNRVFTGEEVKKWESQNSDFLNSQNIIVDEQFKRKNQAQEIYIEEINGTYGSGKRGVAAVAKEKFKIYQKELETYVKEKNKLDSITGIFENKRNEFKAGLENASFDGLFLHRIKAMFDLMKKDSVMLIFCIIFTFIFLIIELIVIIVKSSSSTTNYEKMNELKENINEERIKRMRQRVPEHFDTNEIHPGVKKLNIHLKNNKAKLY